MERFEEYYQSLNRLQYGKVAHPGTSIEKILRDLSVEFAKLRISLQLDTNEDHMIITPKTDEPLKLPQLTWYFKSIVGLPVIEIFPIPEPKSIKKVDQNG